MDRSPGNLRCKDRVRAFGPSENAPRSNDWPWRSVGPDDSFVDDPESDAYNQWVEVGDGKEPSWNSAEQLSNYRLGVVVEHNRNPVRAGARSAIFLHTHGGTPEPTLGCTAMERDALASLVAWLAPDARPVLLQIPGWIPESPS